jgi:hypothetical protein
VRAGFAENSRLHGAPTNGTLKLTRFVLNPDFTEFHVFGANVTNGVTGEEIVAAGLETGGLARGPLFQVWDKNGNLLLTRFVLNPDFTEVKFTKIDINNDGLDEILVVGRETKGLALARGPAIQVWNGNENLLLTQFVLNSRFRQSEGLRGGPEWGWGQRDRGRGNRDLGADAWSCLSDL